MDEACTRHCCAADHCCHGVHNYSVLPASTTCTHTTGGCVLLCALTLLTDASIFRSYYLLVDLDSCSAMLQLPPQSNCLDVAVGVSLLQKTRKRCHSLRYFGTLSFQWRLCLLDLLSFGNCLPLIAIRTFHRTACSLSDVRLHSSTSFVSNVFIILGKIDSHTNNQSPSIMYHFFCMYL